MIEHATLNLFKALPITCPGRFKETSKILLHATLQRGFVFSSEVVCCYTEDMLLRLTTYIGTTGFEKNSTFHKSWAKIKNAPLEQLLLEQLIHYFTTYEAERLGIYREDCVYIPNEKLEVPEITEDLRITIIKGYSKEELKDKLMRLLSGIALQEDTIKDIVEVIEFIGGIDVETIKNYEVKAILYDKLGILPKKPIDFLRYVIFKLTGKTLLIKSEEVIEELRAADKTTIVSLFEMYDHKKLAEIFYRFKPIFLALRGGNSLRKSINHIRRWAVKCHRPLPEDYLNTITHRLKNNEPIEIPVLYDALDKVNVFRKIRLAYALKFRTTNPESILYRIRNGKSWATEFNFSGSKNHIELLIRTILDSINVKPQKIYIPDHVHYALPTTEKQFTGNFPSGSYVSLPSDMIFGVFWKNVDGHRVDLDLSLIDSNGKKFGWDSDFRNEERTILFSGDITDARDGATELFYIQNKLEYSSLLMLNYFNYNKDIEVEVPFDIIIGQDKLSKFELNYMIDPNNVRAEARTKIKRKQLILGLLKVTKERCNFYFAQTYLGNSITSTSIPFAANARKYYKSYYGDTIDLKDILGNCTFVSKEECEVDLSPEMLEKDTILNLIQQE